MLRRLLTAGLLLAIAAPAMAQERTGAFALRSADKGVALIADAQAHSEEAGVGRWERSFATAGLGFAHSGWKLAVAGGQVTYSFSGAGEGVAPLVSLSLGHAVADVWRGTLSVELRRTLLWDAGQRLDIDEARIGWTKRF
jgi:hypothetical protein